MAVRSLPLIHGGPRRKKPNREAPDTPPKTSHRPPRRNFARPAQRHHAFSLSFAEAILRLRLIRSVAYLW
jgi:hypothetical protein